jgi:hypothetical protein
VNRRFRDLDALIRALQAAGVGQVDMRCKVATTTMPGGEWLVFRGRVCVSAETADDRLEYEQEISRRRVEMATDDLAVTAEQATALQRAQHELARQIRLYREWYQSVVSESRETLTRHLQRAGIAVAD